MPFVEGSDSRFSGRPSGPIITAGLYAWAQGVMKMWCSMSGAMRYWTLPGGLEVDSWEILVLASGVRDTGLKTARLPVWSFMTVARLPIFM